MKPHSLARNGVAHGRDCGIFNFTTLPWYPITAWCSFLLAAASHSASQRLHYFMDNFLPLFDIKTHTHPYTNIHIDVYIYTYRYKILQCLCADTYAHTCIFFNYLYLIFGFGFCFFFSTNFFLTLPFYSIQGVQIFHTLWAMPNQQWK